MFWLILKYTAFILLGFSLAVALGVMTGKYIKAGRRPKDIAY